MMQNCKKLILTFTLFLFPLFFLPTTQEFFITNKLYLLVFSSCLLLLLSALETIASNKLKISLTKTDLYKIFFLLAILLSTLIISPNQVQALLNPHFGFISILAILIFTFYLQKSSLNIIKTLSLSTLILSLITIIVYFKPLDNTYLPIDLQFLRNHYFSPIGTQSDLLVFLTFMFSVEIIQLILFFRSKKVFTFTTYYYLLAIIITLFALCINIVNIYYGATEQSMPIRYSWLAFTESLKNPLQALFGIGIDNLPSAFTRVKDISYNLSPLWQVRSFEVSRSSLLHLTTESGLLGLSAVVLIFLESVKSARRSQAFTNYYLLLTIFSILILLIAPPSLIVFLIFFLGITTTVEHKSEQKIIDYHSKKIFANYSLVFVSIILILLFGLSLSQAYRAEFLFKQSINSLARKDGRSMYQQQRQTILANPFIERYHLSFSQTNLLLAKDLIQKKQQATEATEAAKIALIEAEIATKLNPQKASNWENLAVIARNFTDVVDNADLLAQARNNSFAAYEKAIVLDPQNPQYRFSLGTLNYLYGNFTEAIRSFEQAVVLKPNWANAHYNLAWALYQNQEKDKAVQELEAAISLLDKNKDKNDLAKAKQDLATMKKQSPNSAPETFPTNSQLPTLTEPRIATQEFNLNFSPGEILNSASPGSSLQ